MQIGFAVKRIHIRVSVGVDGREVVFPFLVTDIDGAETGEKLPVASVAGRHDAVEHIHAAFDSFQQVYRRTDTHQVTGLVFRQYFIYNLNHFVHLLGRFADSQSADGIPVSSLPGNVFSGVTAQVRIYATLYNREETLLISVFRFRSVETVETTVQPAFGQSQ